MERVDEVKPKKPKSNLKKPKLNSVWGQSTPKSTWSHIDSHNDNFVQDVMSGLNETVSRLKIYINTIFDFIFSEMSDVELPPVFSPDHGEHLDEAMIAMRLKF